ncbi:hypothetical protein PYW07_003399 [Mythimna separata]|uniref:Microsomal glutathione S-transferase 1 n=1 Tax=Mythimna separata TaxID=271217 RepID=A0A9E9JWL6_MYTSE|nr:hypothetical protein PYW07_003399 [Mythimna separata]WAS27881.1 glutathione S-transferase [Mythimna separata]
MKNKSSNDKSYSPLMQTYFLYSALLALKLLAFVPLASVMCQPENVLRANMNDLKNLTLFWLVSALYMTTSPSLEVAKNLLRIYVISRFISATSYFFDVPKCTREFAYLVSFAITGYMSSSVVYYYRDAL